MPVWHVLALPMRIIEAAGLCVWLVAGGILVGWLRWGRP